MKPRRIYADFLVTARGYIRSSAALFFSLVFPVILIGIFGLIFNGGSNPPAVYVLDADHNSAASQNFLAALNQTGAVTVNLVNGQTPQGFANYLNSNQYAAGIVIPAGFQGELANHSAVNLTIFINPGDAATAGATVAATQAVITHLNLRVANATPIVGATTQQLGSTSYTYVDYLVPGLIGFSILTSPMFAMVEVVSSYRKEGRFRQLSLTPLTRSEWLSSKILWYSALTLASAAVMIVIGLGVFHSHVMLPLSILPFLFVGPFLFVSLGMLAGSLARTPESAAILGNIVTFPMMFLSGTFFPVSSFPPALQTFAHILPLYYVIDGLEAVMLFGNTTRAIVDLAIVFVIALIIFLAAVRVFRWRDE